MFSQLHQLKVLQITLLPFMYCMAGRKKHEQKYTKLHGREEKA
jgi:hypothetical protein